MCRFYFSEQLLNFIVKSSALALAIFARDPIGWYLNSINYWNLVKQIWSVAAITAKKVDVSQKYLAFRDFRELSLPLKFLIVFLSPDSCYIPFALLS